MSTGGPSLTECPAPAILLARLPRSLLAAIRRKIPLRVWIIGIFIRYALTHLPPRYIQALVPTAPQWYTAWLWVTRARQPRPSDRLRRHVVPLSTKPDASLVWIGDVARATKFVLLLPGAANVLPLNPVHLTWSWNAFVQDGRTKHVRRSAGGHEVAVAIVR